MKNLLSASTLLGLALLLPASLPAGPRAVVSLRLQDGAGKKTPPQRPGPGMISLKDGRFILEKPIRKVKGGLEVLYRNGKVLVPDSMILDYYSPDTTLQYTPKNEIERKRLAKGLVPIGRRWVRKSLAEREMRKLTEKRKKEIEEQKAHRLWRNRYIVETKDFIFEHNLPLPLFKELRELFEVYLKTFLKKWRKKPHLPRKPRINLYADHGDYSQISGAKGGIVGWYHPMTQELHLYWDRRDPKFTINVLFHETNHLLSDMINGDFRYPDWIEEPMAEYYGASKWNPRAKDKTKRMTMGHVQASRLAVVKTQIKEGEKLKLKDMLRIPDFGAVHYAWGWTFIHFLMNSKKYAKRWEKYYLDLAHKKTIRRKPLYGKVKTVTPETAEKLLLKYLRVKSLDALEKEWYAYIDSLEIEDVDGYAAAGRHFRMLGEWKEAKKYLKKAVDLGVKNPYAYMAYADLLGTSGKDRKEAIRLLDKAISLDPLEAEFRYRKGRLLLTFHDDKRKQEGLRLVRLAAEMNPEDWTYIHAVADIEEEMKREDRKNG